MKDIKYHYAYNELNELVAIEDVDEVYRQNHSFHCINCGDEMIARLGCTRIHHFSHKKCQESCNIETYLHKLAKIVLKQKFYSESKFNISLVRHCICEKSKDCMFYDSNECCESICETFDLKEYYDTCSEEKGVDGYIADLLLTDSSGKYKHPILIEFVVTHKCSSDKRESGLRIIEIKIDDEYDITRLKTEAITEENAEFIGFSKESKQKMVLERTLPFKRFILHRDGNTFVSKITCKNGYTKLQDCSILELNMDIKEEMCLYRYGYVKAMELGFQFRNCCLCRCSRYYDNYSVFSCLHGHASFDIKEAMRCPYYIEDTFCIDRVKESMKSIPLSIPIHKKGENFLLYKVFIESPTTKGKN